MLQGIVSVVSTFALGGQVAAAPRTGAIRHPGGETAITAAESLALPEPCLPPCTAHLLTACPLPGVSLNAEYLFVKGRVQYSLDYILVGL